MPTHPVHQPLPLNVCAGGGGGGGGVRVELDPAEIEVLGWLFDIHLGEKGAIPCFGLQVPHVYVPISEIFISVYNDCKKILGVTAARTVRPQIRKGNAEALKMSGFGLHL